MRLIKLSKNELSPLLTIIFNIFLNDGIFPDTYKIAKVIPLYKGGGYIVCRQYRSI